MIFLFQTTIVFPSPSALAPPLLRPGQSLPGKLPWSYMMSKRWSGFGLNISPTMMEQLEMLTINLIKPRIVLGYQIILPHRISRNQWHFRIYIIGSTYPICIYICIHVCMAYVRTMLCKGISPQDKASYGTVPPFQGPEIPVEKMRQRSPSWSPLSDMWHDLSQKNGSEAGCTAAGGPFLQSLHPGGPSS